MTSLLGDLLSLVFAMLFLLAVFAATTLGVVKFFAPRDSDEKWLWDEGEG